MSFIPFSIIRKPYKPVLSIDIGTTCKNIPDSEYYIKGIHDETYPCEFNEGLTQYAIQEVLNKDLFFGHQKSKDCFHTVYLKQDNKSPYIFELDNIFGEQLDCYLIFDTTIQKFSLVQIKFQIKYQKN